MAIDAESGAVYAADPRKSRGRRYAEPPSPTRNDFRRDCDRLIHATAFRRLKYKTQVFVFHEGDHYRTRLTHSLEVAQIARALARALRLDEDLGETLALAHDLGHPPFGHAGERALDACLREHGGFDHNAQALRILTELERRYPDFDGLNLTWETLEGVVKHNGPLTAKGGDPIGRYRGHGLPEAIRAYNAIQDLELWSHANAEAQAAAIADDIAYDAHDIDDGLRANLFALEDIATVPLIGSILGAIRDQHPKLDNERVVHELVRRLIGAMVEDVIAETKRRLADTRPQSPEDIRSAERPVVGFSTAMAEHDKAIKGFLYPRMYRHARIERIMKDAESVVHDLFEHFRTSPQEMPPEWGVGADAHARIRSIADYIAGMTDRYALVEHARFFPATPDLR